jgi:hypothetical protein
MQSAAACSICNKHDHSATKCPELREPLKEGFYMGGGVSRGGGGDEDDHVRISIQLYSIDIVKPILVVN